MPADYRGRFFKGDNMVFYFEYRDNFGELKRFEITTTRNGWLILESIEKPCNDRQIVAIGDTVAELVDWTLQNFK